MDKSVEDALVAVSRQNKTKPTAVETKRCKHCKVQKPLADFALRTKKSNLRVRTCLVCLEQRRLTEYFRCNRCQESKTGVEFNKGYGAQAIKQPCYDCKRSVRDAKTRSHRIEQKREPYHLLTDINIDLRTAFCRECGPVHIFATGAKTGKGWRCGKRSDQVSRRFYERRTDIVDHLVASKWHRISQVDGPKMRGICSQCGDVPVSWNQSGQYFVCKSPVRKRQHADVERTRRRLSKYNLTNEEYAFLLEKQNGVCAICKEVNVRSDSDGSLAIDHDHITGKVRGLLCDLCNTGLGHFRDNPELLKMAISYLELGSSK